jgi:hypothetical protein
VQINKKLIVFSILAVVIGVTSILPLSFLMTQANAQTPYEKPWFNIKIVYAYWTANLTETSNRTVSWDVSNYLFFNYSLNDGALDKGVEGRIEYYQIQVYSDKAPLENITEYFGYNSTGPIDPSSSFAFAHQNWFNATDGGTLIVPGENSTNTYTLSGSGSSTSGLDPPKRK